MTAPDETAAIWQAIRQLQSQSVRYVEAPVTQVNAAGSTFAVKVDGTQDGLELAGITAPRQFLPDEGQKVRLAVAGAQPIYQPMGIAQGAITDRELDESLSSTITVALSTANGKNAATFSPNDPSGSGTKSGDIWWKRNPDTGVIIGTWQWDGDSWEPTTFGDGVFDSVSAGKIVTGVINAGVQIIAGDPAAEHTALEATGLFYRQLDSTTGGLLTIARWGRTLGGRNPATGQQTYAVDEEGGASFTGLSVDDDPVFQGTPLSQMLSDNGGGRVVAFAEDWPNPGTTTSEIGIIELACITKPGYRYEVQADGMIPKVTGPDGVTIRFQLRYTTDGTAPLISSPTLGFATANAKFAAYPWENEIGHIRGIFNETSTTPRTLRVGLSMSNGNGATNTQLHADDALCKRIMTLKEVGPIAGTSAGQVNYMGAAGRPTPPATARLSSETIFDGTWWQIYNGNGTAISDGSNGWQGNSPGGQGNCRTFVGFPDMTAIMAGATIDYIRVWTYWNYWFDSRGGFISLGVHQNATAPSPASGQPNISKQFTAWRVPRSSGIWIDLPSSWFPSFASGLYKGIAVGPAPNLNANDWFGKFDCSSGRRPKIAIGWRK